MKAYYIILLVFLVSCSSSSEKAKTEKSKEAEPTDNSTTEEVSDKELSSNFMVKLTKVDNIAHVSVDDSVIYKSPYTLGGENEVSYIVDITELIENGAEKVTVTLYNGTEPYTMEQVDTYWEIMYDLILDGEIVDFVHEIKQVNEVGNVFETEYLVDEWRIESN